MRRSTLRMILKASLSAFALLLLATPISVPAAGLGKLTVLSVLGQPLRAEVDLNASSEELASLSAHLATPEAFKQAGIEYVPAVSGIRFAVDKRANGQPFLHLSSERSINEAFLDILVEMSWSSGRLVREYTFLLDPPAAAPKVAAPVTLPESPPASSPPAPAPAMQQPVAPAAVAPAPVAPAVAPPPGPLLKPRVAAVKPAATRTVKSGDTLGRIALQTKPEGVSLDQMLVALFRGNEDAFDAHNMNRLRAGRILNIPEVASAQVLDEATAKKTVVAQAADFNAYRKKLAAAVAGAPVKETAPQQAASGKIAPKVQDKAPAPLAGKDKLEVSKSAAAKDVKAAADATKRIASLEEDLLARGKALREANERITALEKNVGDLKKLMELKSESMAKAQQQAQVATAAKPEPAKPEAAKSAAEKTEAPQVEAPKAELAQLEVAKPPPPPKPVPPKPAAPKAVAEPLPAPSFIDENPETVYGGVGVAALLLAYLGYSARRRKRLAAGPDAITTSRSSEGINSTRSVIASTGGQSVDTTDSSLLTDFSQSGAPADGDEGVDPVAEADVYMAYGRDTQAEEILLEALKTDPARHAIRLKLLEIYAARKSQKQFEAVATDLYSRTGGVGSDWDKAAILVQKIDPENPLYGRRPAELGEPPPALSEAEQEAQGLAVQERTPVLEPEPAPAELEPPAEEVPMSLDFDLDLGAPEPAPVESVAMVDAAADEGPAALDFDLAPVATEDRFDALAAPAAMVESHEDLDMVVTVAEPAATAAAEEAGLEFPQAQAIEFDAETADESAKVPAFDLDLGETQRAAPAAPAPSFDLSGIDLDLDVPAPAEAAQLDVPAFEAPATTSAGSAVNEEVATKLELAHAYEEMGDKEGARELLEEVIKEGNAEQQDAARVKLAQLG